MKNILGLYLGTNSIGWDLVNQDFEKKEGRIVAAELKQPAGEYKKITAFSSFEEMADDQLKYFATLSPEELLLNNKRMSKAAFGITGNSVKGDKDLKIKFNKEE